MQEKLKQLELLITQTLARQKELAGENATLKNRLRNLEQSNLELKDLQTQLRELKEWKKNTQSVLQTHSRAVSNSVLLLQEP